VERLPAELADFPRNPGFFVRRGVSAGYAAMGGGEEARMNHLEHNARCRLMWSCHRMNWRFFLFDPDVARHYRSMMREWAEIRKTGVFIPLGSQKPK
jgi:hypothetical protein